MSKKWELEKKGGIMTDNCKRINKSNSFIPTNRGCHLKAASAKDIYRRCHLKAASATELWRPAINIH